MSKTTQNPRRRRKKSGKKYFTAETEAAIGRYNEETDLAKKDAIFTKEIYIPFRKIAENLINVYRYNYLEDTKQASIDDAVSYMVSIIHKFDPVKGKGKAFGYFSVVCKRYMMGKNQKNMAHRDRTLYINTTPSDDDTAFDIEDPTLGAEDEYVGREMLSEMLTYWRRNIPSLFISGQDQEIAYAIIDILDTIGRSENIGKGKMFALVREKLGTQFSCTRRVLGVLTESYTELKYKYNSVGEARDTFFDDMFM